jgi:hypothetical protein
VICEKVWNGSGRPQPPELPTARRDNITVGPGETLIVYPTNWMDLNGSIVVIEGETSPGSVLNLVAIEAGGQAHISWDAPADDGGWPILEYNVFRGPSPDNLTLIGTVSERSFIDNSVERGATYYYSIRALNVLGEGQMAPVVDIHQSGMHLLQMINDILDLSKVEAGKMELHLETFSLAESIKDIQSIIRDAANKKNLNVQTIIPDDLPDVTADPVKFKQIMYNLLSNATKFTPAGGSVTVEIEFHEFSIDTGSHGAEQNIVFVCSCGYALEVFPCVVFCNSRTTFIN